MRRLVAAGALLALLAVLWLWWGSGPEPAPPAATAPRRAPAPPVAAPRTAPAAAPAVPPRAREPLPDSLRSTRADGAFTLDASGHLLPSPAILRRFDYYLSARGEEPLAAIRARIEADIAEALPPGAAVEARALLDHYLAYRAAARELHARGLAPGDLDTRLQRIRELRREHFGAGTARLLFEQEERLAEAALEQRRIELDPDLDPAERERRLEGVEAGLPPSLAAARAAATLPLRLQQDEAALRDAGADPAEIRRLREETVGVEAAERLEALDAHRREWERRLALYREQRDALLATRAPAADALEELRIRHFAPEELARVRGLDRIDGVAPAPDTATP
jgi:lipase chaperone LimK